MIFSVIMPAYNRAGFIRRAAMSVFNQDCIPNGEIELIVIDDGSTDNTKDTVLSITPPNGHKLLYLSIEHCGQPGTTRNVGLLNASGEFIAYCDSDDFWLPNHLATVWQEFKKDPNLGMVSNFWSFARFWMQDNGDPGCQYEVAPHSGETVNTNCRVHRRSCLDTVGNFNTSRWGEDQDFFKRVETKFPHKKTYIPTNVNGYIKGGNNLTYNFDQNIKARYQ